MTFTFQTKLFFESAIWKNIQLQEYMDNYDHESALSYLL